MTLGLLPLRPLDASLDGFRNDALFNITMLMVSVLFVVISGILLYAILFHRDGRRRASYERGNDRRHLVFTAVITAVIFFGVDGTLLVDSYLDLDQVLWNFPRPDEHPLTVEIVAQQWAWNIRYAGPDGLFGTPDDVVTLNELHVPVGRPVVVHMKSKDVVHSFYLPNFRVKQDVVPGLETRAWFAAKLPGSYELGCAQHCGVSHYRMRGLVTVESAADFDAWTRAQAAVAAKKYDEDDVEAHWGWPWL
ncbi:MAG: cytochrome c oxidase subunit II [Myxococcales bacterium]|nr:cytochrome c oxidase subunit II [Myxococcales bacterium]